MQIARITIELLKPIPIAPLSVEAFVAHDGKRAQTVEAVLRAGDVDVARAVALRIRSGDVELPARMAPALTVPSYDRAEPFVFPFFSAAIGYHTAVEVRFGRGRFGDGDVVAWMRPRVALVEGETMSPVERLMIAADSGNGVSVVLDTSRYTFINPDLSVHLFRLPRGEWIALEAITRASREGVGLASAELHDELGPIGVSAQTLLVAAR